VSTPTPLGTLGGDSFTQVSSDAFDINTSGHVVGGAATANGASHAFLWTPGGTDGVPSNPQMKDLGTLGSDFSSARGINDNGQIVGWSYTASGSYDAFLWTPGGTDGVPSNPQMKDLGTLPGFSNSIANDINGAGQVVGYVEKVGTSIDPEDAFLWQNGVGMTDLGTLRGGSGLQTVATAINGSSPVQVVGYGYTQVQPRSLHEHAFRWQNGVMTDLGTLTGQKDSNQLSEAYDINDSSQVVGYSHVTSGGNHAFIWQQSTGMVDLNTLIDSSLGWTLGVAWGINGNGQIVGGGKQGGTAGLGYRLTPTTAAASSLTAASSGTATPTIASPATLLGTTTAGFDDFGSVPQGPLGVIPTAATWAAVPRLAAHRRHATGVPDLLSTALDPDGR
jgi:probable HAF family extracellular repeat protein